MRFRSLIVVATSCLVACSDGVAPNSAAAIVGTYSLVRYNDQPLPAVFFLGSVYLAGTLAVNADGSYAWSDERRVWSDRTGKTQEVQYNERGTYQLVNDSTAIFQPADDSAYQGRMRAKTLLISKLGDLRFLWERR